MSRSNIASAAGALKTSTWSSLDDQNYNAVDGSDVGSTPGDTPGEGWDEAGGSNANQLIELFLGAAGSTLAPNATLNLGSAYNTSIFGGANGDLVFKFGVLNGSLVTAPVTYVSTGVAGDYNHNGVVDAADYVVWRKTLGQTGVGLAADGDNNGTVNSADYAIWRGNFGLSGSGAGVGNSATVPEPATISIVALSLMGIIGWRKR